MTTRRNAEQIASPKIAGRRLAVGAAGMAFASELIHLWVLPGEFTLAPMRGAFFLLVAMAQGALAVNLLFGPRRWTLRLGLILNVAIVATWAFTRLVGLPMLITFVRLPVGWLDLTATALEIALIATLIALRRMDPSAVARTRG
ncbi:hypothetical protein [Sphaerobacter sp.]|uniref:hypothetical protein n=1 Tax=Sphaerobacter sp. TaxID=2099654 RepID=UPI001D644138|nr:hypothetical protein [Sphaerobacter sp.]MBX5446406.1 hypothetical protein [Sphaerobacter sp.]